jgi:hypothetical protein
MEEVTRKRDVEGRWSLFLNKERFRVTWPSEFPFIPTIVLLPVPAL